jgi:hypothetical protein
VGWCSATSIFDTVIDAVIPEVSPERLTIIAAVIADALWDQDWDCESDSKYYETLLFPIMVEKGYAEWDDLIDEDE